MKRINSDAAPAAVGPYSQAMQSGNLLFCSGQIPLDPATMQVVEGGVEAQTKQVFANIIALLGSQGLSLDKVVKATVFLDDMNDFQAVNAIYAESFGDHKPARSCVAVDKLPMGVLVEIEVIVELSA